MINPVKSFLTRVDVCKVMMYADDTVIFFSALLSYSYS